MLTRLVSITILLTHFIVSPITLASGNQTQQNVQNSKLTHNDEEFFAFITELYQEEEYTRPASCPLEPKGHADMLNKIKAIELLLNNECLGKEASTVEKILAGASGIKDELDKANNATPSEPVTVDGNQVTNYLTALNSINNLYIKMKCEGQRMSFLNKTAEFISGIAQLGLLSTNPNGIIVAAAGSAISAILRIIDDMFTKQYEFKYEDERMAFVKINCAFRDFRRDLQKSGLLQAGDDIHRRYAQKLDTLISRLSDKIGKLDGLKGEAARPFQATKQQSIGPQLAEITKLDQDLQKLIELFSVDVEKDQIKMRRSLLNLYKFGKSFQSAGQSTFFNSLNKQFFNNTEILNNVLIFPEDFNQSLAEFLPNDPAILKARASSLMIAEYTQSAGQMSAYLGLIQEDLRAYKAKIEADYQEQSKAQHGDLTANAALASATKNISEEKAKLESKLGRLKQVKDRVDNILMDEKIVSTDDGSLNMVTIMEKYLNVESKFYGDLGKQFMDFVVDEGVDAIKDFDRKMKKFETSHTIEVEQVNKSDANGAQIVDYHFIDASKYSYEQKKRACQDLRGYSIRFSLANGLMNAGYDYIWTNRDLFHSDYSKKLFRLFGLLSAESQKYLQYHEKSATRANILINGGSIDRDAFDKYIKGDGLSLKQSKMRPATEAICRIGSQTANRFPAKGKNKDRRPESSNPEEFSSELAFQVSNLIRSDKRTQGMLMLLVDQYREKAEFLSLVDSSFKCEKILSQDVDPNLKIDGATEGDLSIR